MSKLMSIDDVMAKLRQADDLPRQRLTELLEKRSFDAFRQAAAAYIAAKLPDPWEDKGKLEKDVFDFCYGASVAAAFLSSPMDIGSGLVNILLSAARAEGENEREVVKTGGEMYGQCRNLCTALPVDPAGFSFAASAKDFGANANTPLDRGMAFFFETYAGILRTLVRESPRQA